MRGRSRLIHICLAALFAFSSNTAVLAGKAMSVPELKKAIANSPEDAHLHFQLGMAYEQQGKVAEAIASFRQALQMDPEDSASLEQLVTIYGARHDWPNAKDCAVHWLELSPGNPHAHMLKAWCELAAGELRDSKEDLEQARTVSPDDPDINNLYGLVLAELGKAQQAEAAFKSVLEHRRDDLPAQLNLALLYLQQGRAGEAKDLTDNAQKTAPGDPSSLAAAALVATVLADSKDGEARLSSLKEADEKARQALEKESHNALARVALARVMKAKGDEAARAKELEQAMSDQPASIFVMNELAAALCDRKEYAKSAQLAQQALQLAPANSEAKKILGRSLSKQGNWDGAILLLKEVAARNPSDTTLRCELASAQESKGDLDSAVMTYQAALKTNPQEAHAAIGLARIALAGEDSSEQIALAEKAVALAPADAEAHTLLAEALYKKRKYVPSLSECRYALSLDAANRRALCLTGRNLFEQHDWKQAETYLAQCVKSKDATADNWLMLALAQERKPDADSAFSTLQSASEAFPGDPKIAEALERLSRKVKKSQKSKGVS